MASPANVNSWLPQKADKQVPSTKPYGYVDGEKAVLKRMKRLHRKPRGGERPSYYQVAKRLNEEGLTSRSGRPWSYASVRRILTR